MWVPHWLWSRLFGTVDFTQQIDEEREDTIHIDLHVSHTLFGEIFGYIGTFRVTRTNRE